MTDVKKFLIKKIMKVNYNVYMHRCVWMNVSVCVLCSVVQYLRGVIHIPSGWWSKALIPYILWIKKRIIFTTDTGANTFIILTTLRYTQIFLPWQPLKTQIKEETKLVLLIDSTCLLMVYAYWHYMLIDGTCLLIVYAYVYWQYMLIDGICLLIVYVYWQLITFK